MDECKDMFKILTIYLLSRLNGTNIPSLWDGFRFVELLRTSHPYGMHNRLCFHWTSLHVCFEHVVHLPKILRRDLICALITQISSQGVSFKVMRIP
jgi:hypothetical protein